MRRAFKSTRATFSHHLLGFQLVTTIMGTVSVALDVILNGLTLVS